MRSEDIEQPGRSAFVEADNVDEVAVISIRCHEDEFFEMRAGSDWWGHDADFRTFPRLIWHQSAALNLPFFRLTCPRQMLKIRVPCKGATFEHHALSIFVAT